MEKNVVVEVPTRRINELAEMARLRLELSAATKTIEQLKCHLMNREFWHMGLRRTVCELLGLPEPPVPNGQTNDDVK